MERPQWRRYSMPPQGGYNGFKVAVAIIVFHFGVKMLVQFADLLLPFIMSLILVTVLEPVKQYTLEVLECTFLLIFSKLPCCRCCLKTSRKTAGYGNVDKREKIDLSGGIKKILLFIAIVLTILLAFRIFWFVGQIVWLSGEAVMHDFKFYKMGVGKRTSQVQDLLHRFHLEKSIPTDMKHMGDFALSLLQYVAQFLSQQVFYTLTQVSLTAIFVLFLLFSPVQRDFSPVMQGVFESMELYLKLKTFISAMMGVTNGIALAVIGLELPAAWGLLTFLANFIPNIGGPVVSIVPCVISLLDARKSLTQVTMAFFVQFFLHFNIANFVEPMVFGSSEDIHSVVVLLGLSFFGYIWGFTGMFLSVPLLFAMHAWLDTIAKRENYGQEAREDARFIMGMLEGRWLASAEDAGEDAGGGGVNLLTGHIEEEEQPEEPDRPVAVGHSASAANEAHPPISDWKVLGRLQELFAARDHQTGEVIVIGLLLRWIVVASGYTLFFFGFMIFHWDLHALIHPSGGQIFGANHTAHESNVSSHEAPVLHVEAPKAPLVQLVSTTMAATAAQVMTMAPGFPFRGSPKLEGADLPEVPESGNILKIHTTGMPEEATQAASSTRAGLPDGGEWAGAVPFAVPSAEGVAAFGAPNGDRGARLKLRPGPSVAPEAKGEEVPRTGGATSSTQSSTSSREVDQVEESDGPDLETGFEKRQ